MNEQLIVRDYNIKVKGKTVPVDILRSRHDGAYGHWLEQQFEISPNADNKPDLYGFELKSETTSKTSFGDWSADYYIYKDRNNFDIFDGRIIPEKQDQFLRIFTRPNPDKNNRHSWSGRPCPKINQWTPQGQILVVNSNNDIQIFYSYSQDTRTNKASIVPAKFQCDDLLIAQWNKDSIKNKVENKFDQNGWFTCKIDHSTGVINELCIGDPINYLKWINWVKIGVVFFDSGMYEGNKRPYSQWRAANSLWNDLIVRRY